MTSILSSVSGQFSKALILGAFFPTALFVLLSWLFLSPLIPSEWAFLAPLKTLDPQWQLGAFTILTIILSGIIHNLNIPLIRLYEGYRWRDTLFGRLLSKSQENKRADLRNRYDKLQALASSLPGGEKHPYYDAVVEEWNSLGKILARDFPRFYSILPTRLGNVLRNSEEYPDYQYGIDGITLWPRLVAVIEDKYAKSLDEARIPLDFMIYSAFLSSLLAGLLLIVGLFNPVLLSDQDMWHLYVPWLAQIGLLVFVSWLFYRGAVAQAYAWGNVFRGAFDLYKSKLFSGLGYSQDLSTRAAEYTLWDLISRQMLYGHDEGTNKPRVDYADQAPAPVPPTSVEYKRSQTEEAEEVEGAQDAQDAENHLQITRGIRRADRESAVTVYVGIRNNHPKDDQHDVVIIDHLPEGFEYRWGTARVLGKEVEVVGIDPYRFRIGTVGSGKEVVLTYQITHRETLLANVQLGFWRGLLRALFSLA